MDEETKQAERGPQENLDWGKGDATFVGREEDLQKGVQRIHRGGSRKEKDDNERKLTEY